MRDLCAAVRQVADGVAYVALYCYVPLYCYLRLILPTAYVPLCTPTLLILYSYFTHTLNLLYSYLPHEAAHVPVRERESVCVRERERVSRERERETLERELYIDMNILGTASMH